MLSGYFQKKVEGIFADNETSFFIFFYKCLDQIRLIRINLRIGNMLEQINNLKECENFLKEYIKKENIKILGDIPINEEDYSKLKNFFSCQNYNVDYLIDKSEMYPISFAVFIVFFGIFKYREGVFWPTFEKEIKINNLTIIDETKIREKFENILSEYNLKKFRSYKTHKEYNNQDTINEQYIQSILAHGRIPNYYLDLYFQLLDSLLNSSMVLLTELNAKAFIQNWRKIIINEYKRKILREKILNYKNEIKDLEDLFNLWDLISEYERIKRDIPYLNIIIKLLKHSNNHHTLKKQEIANLKNIEIQIRNQIRSLLEKIHTIAPFIQKCDVYFSRSQDSHYLIFGLVLIKEISQYILHNFIKNIINNQFLQNERFTIKFYLLSKQQINNWLMPLCKNTKDYLNILKEVLNLYREKAITVEKELNEYFKYMRILGQGNYEKGEENYLKYSDVLKKLYDKVEEQKLETYLKNKKRFITKEGLRQEIEEYKRTIKDYKIKYKQQKSEIDNQLYLLRRSSEIYFLDGEQEAEFFFYNTLLALKKLKEGKLIDNDIKQIITQRISDELVLWWQGRQDKSIYPSIEKDNILKLTDPIYYLDIKDNTICILIKKVTYSILNNDLPKNIKISLVDEEDNCIEEKSLNFFKERDFLITDDKVLFCIPSPNKKYYIKYETLTNTIVKKLNKNSNDIWIFDQKQNFFSNNQIPDHNNAYLVVPKSYQVHEKDLIIYETPLLNSWEEYKRIDLSLENINFITILDSKNQKFILRKKIFNEPQLIGGNLIKPLTIDVCLVYSDKLPYIDLFLLDNNDIKYWDINIFNPGKDEKLINISEINDIDIEASEKGTNVRILLDKLIIEKEIGKYEIILRNRKNFFRKEFYFFYLNHIDLVFSPSIIYPKDTKATLKINSVFPISFLQVDQTYELIKKSDDEHLMIIDLLKNYKEIEGIVTFNNDNKKSFTYKIELPSILWKENSESIWKHNIEEVWYEGIQDIFIKIPGNFNKPVLKYKNKTIELKRKEELFCCNTKQYCDELLNINENVIPIELRLNEKDDAFELFKIRTRIEYILDVRESIIDNNKWKIEINLKVKGKNTDYEMFLWNVSSKNCVKKYSSKSLKNITQFEPGNFQIIIFENISKVPFGLYKLQVVSSEIINWSYEIKYPDNENNGVCYVNFGKQEYFEQLMMHFGIVINQIDGYDMKCQEKIIDCNKKYLIHNIKREMAKGGGNWFHGSLFLINKNGREPVEEGKDVFFDIDKKGENQFYIPYFVCYSLDGAIYCTKCEKIFWDEKRDNHKSEDQISVYAINVDLYMSEEQKNGFRSIKDQ